MINAAVIGLGWWGQNILNNLRDSEVIRPVLGVDLDAAFPPVTHVPRFRR